MKTRTLVVDGNNLFKRSINGAKNLHNSKGQHIGGLYQFFTSIRKLITKYMINKVIIFWDGEGGGIYRYRIDRMYKSNRKNKEWYIKIELSAAEIRREKEKELSSLYQMKRIQAYAEEIFFRQILIDDIEADDLIAEYCYTHNNKEELFIYSNDRDFAQLFDTVNLTILFPNIEQPVTKINYSMYFNHHYSNALTMKIMCGDIADVIKGIEGIGEDTLIKHFPELKYKPITVREICAKADEINKTRILNKKKPLKSLENLVNGVSRLKTNYKLICLRDPILNEDAKNALIDLELPLSPDDRGSKNLYKMMIEDEFLSAYGSTFVQYIEPFYTVIMNEKQLLTEYLKENKNIL